MAFYNFFWEYSILGGKEFDIRGGASANVLVELFSSRLVCAEAGDRLKTCKGQIFGMNGPCKEEHEHSRPHATPVCVIWRTLVVVTMRDSKNYIRVLFFPIIPLVPAGGGGSG